MDEVDVVIVGAGISGLSAACLLSQEHGLSVKVLEARDRVGGRTLTVKDPAFGAVDLGGAYVGAPQNRVFRLAKKLGLKFYDVNEKQHTVLNLKGTWQRFKGSVPPFWNPLVLLDLNNVIRLVDRMSEEVPVGAPWLAPRAVEWDTITLKEFIEKNTWTSSTRALITIVSQTVFTSEPHEISLLFFLWSVISGGGLMRLISITNGAQEKKIIGGAQQLSEGLVDLLTPGSVQLSSPVVQIYQEEDRVKVTTAAGNQYTAKYVVSAVPQAILNKIHFTPTLSGLRSQLIQRIPMGSIIKTVVFYETAFWRELDFCGSLISDDGPVAYTIDDTKHDGSQPAIVGFILANKSRELCQLSVQERKQAICEQYARTFRCDRFLDAVGYLEKDWMAEEYSGGCYVSNYPPGVLTKYGSILRQPEGRVFFAGTESATYFVGYMEGAIQAGERAAREVLFRMGRIPEDEIWQEEPESADFPAVDISLSYIEKVLPSVGGLLYTLTAVLVGCAAYTFYRLF